jgi:cytidylate kinase
MIITISGSPGSGKSTVAAIVAKRFGLNHYSSGDFMRRMARKQKMSMIQLIKIANKTNSVDDEIDEWVSKLAKYEDNFVIDSRLAFYFIPNSIKIFLDVDIKEGSKRILLQKRDDEPENSDLRATINNIEKRKKSEKKRYRRLYKMNPFNKKNYDAYMDTTGLTLEQVAHSVIKFIESTMKPKKEVEVVEKKEMTRKMTKKRKKSKKVKKKVEKNKKITKKPPKRKTKNKHKAKKRKKTKKKTKKTRKKK